MSTPLLSIRGLRVGIPKRRGADEIVRGVSLDVASGEKVGIVGESGSGKTLTMLSVTQLLPTPPLAVLGGEILFDGEDVLKMDRRRLREVRGGEIAMVYQDPMSSLNPLLRVSTQIIEALRAHGTSKEAARERMREVLVQVGLQNPERVESSFPHQLSGGMIQRVMIAMALSTSPRVLVADEPTTALDVTIQRQILELVDSLQATTHMAVLWVTHDLGVVATLVDRVVVMYAGRIVEQAPTAQLFSRPTHPYTKALLESLPELGSHHRSSLHQIGGTPPDATHLEVGCPFRARCPYSVQRCSEAEPDLIDRGSGSFAACWREPSEWTK
ncbi:MAG TPA: ABC transporter ATP-binding protein [Acidimicrobiales bacterium]